MVPEAGGEPPRADYSDKFDAALRAAREGDFSKAASEAAQPWTTPALAPCDKSTAASGLAIGTVLPRQAAGCGVKSLINKRFFMPIF